MVQGTLPHAIGNPRVADGGVLRSGAAKADRGRPHGDGQKGPHLHGNHGGQLALCTGARRRRQNRLLVDVEA
eukprot:3499309-Prorocentrum_lima.AAC.1